MKEKKMTEQELNRKLAEWAGFKEIEYQRCSCHPERKGRYWHDPNNDYLPECPDFTQSLDACFKWLVPKLKHYEINNWVEKNRVWVGDNQQYKVASAETPALALCLAIEKLIDKSQ